MYRNAYYNSKDKCVHLFTWNEDGDRTVRLIPFKPYLYVEDQRGTAKSIFGTKLTLKEFESSYDRNRFVKESGIRRLFENISPAQQFLIDEYIGLNEDISFSKNPLKMCLLDIETYSPDGFPDVENPEHPVNVISCYDTLLKKQVVFGTKQYTGDNKKVSFYYCKTEADLFLKFLEYLEKDYPDIMSGWNSDFFDIPYIYNRGMKVIGDQINRISPLGLIRKRYFMGKFGKEQCKIHIQGMSVVDYLDVYKKFTMENRESYKLDAIGEVELGENKVDLGGESLAAIADKDWNRFIDYNIQDVQLLVKLEEKLKYLSLLRMLAYTGLTNLEGALGTLQVVTGGLCMRARQKGEIIGTFVRKHDSGQNPGAYVGEPRRGFSESIISFDANSLYPNLMITLNTSPETKVATFTISGDEVYVKHVSGKMLTLTKPKFVEWVKLEKLAISKAGVLFTQKKKGILADFVDYYYKERVVTRAILKKKKLRQKEIEKDKTKKEELKQLEVEIENLNTKQHTQKILINSSYGYCGNKQAPLGDDDIASSITLSGQAVIKYSNKLFQQFVEKSIPECTNAEESVIYNDTDSGYFSLKPFIQHGLIDSFLDEEGKVTAKVFEVAADLEEYMNAEIKKFATSVFNSTDPRLAFKREVLANTGIFLQKKRYTMHIQDDEGIPCDKVKYKGVEVVRTTMPKPIKPYAKNIIETMMKTKDYTKTTSALTEAYEVLIKMPPEEIAFVMGLKGYEARRDACDGFKTVKGMPVHAKSAHYYNLLLEELNLGVRYEKLGSGDKVRYMYINPRNKWGIKTIAFKYSYPEEFKSLFQIDYDMMFEKILFKCIQRFYDAVDWNVRKTSEQVTCEIVDLFS